MKIKKLFLSLIPTVVLIPSCNNSASMNYYMQNNNLKNASKYEINLEGQKYQYTDIESFMSNLINSNKIKVENKLVIGKKKNNSSNKILDSTIFYNFDPNKLKKVYQNKFQKTVYSVDEVIESFREESSYIKKYLFANKEFDSEEKVKQYIKTQLKNGFNKYVYYSNNGKKYNAMNWQDSLELLKDKYNKDNNVFYPIFDNNNNVIYNNLLNYETMNSISKKILEKLMKFKVEIKFGLDLNDEKSYDYNEKDLGFKVNVKNNKWNVYDGNKLRRTFNLNEFYKFYKNGMKNHNGFWDATSKNVENYYDHEKGRFEDWTWIVKANILNLFDTENVELIFNDIAMNKPYVGTIWLIDANYTIHKKLKVKTFVGYEKEHYYSRPVNSFGPRIKAYYDQKSTFEELNNIDINNFFSTYQISNNNFDSLSIEEKEQIVTVYKKYIEYILKNDECLNQIKNYNVITFDSYMNKNLIINGNDYSKKIDLDKIDWDDYKPINLNKIWEEFDFSFSKINDIKLNNKYIYDKFYAITGNIGLINDDKSQILTANNRNCSLYEKNKNSNISNLIFQRKTCIEFLNKIISSKSFPSASEPEDKQKLLKEIIEEHKNKNKLNNSFFENNLPLLINDKNIELFSFYSNNNVDILSKRYSIPSNILLEFPTFYSKDDYENNIALYFDENWHPAYIYRLSSYTLENNEEFPTKEILDGNLRYLLSNQLGYKEDLVAYDNKGVVEIINNDIFNVFVLKFEGNEFSFLSYNDAISFLKDYIITRSKLI
ncbi:Uncharacterised protein (plasmid) [Mesomycoplasma conjunctivae]|nr:hypothetical protein [Mycoplasmopsis fermentans]ADV34067.1 Hypothetical Protein MfeM64YM_0057 [Mycoplasmopsis fermentans M64]VEU60096.1 Uncharacterised protein [Mycoplasmopsis fermentans]VEU66896.1 Uncharacterised protein [Mesomycoplasma conjunctivae]